MPWGEAQGTLIGRLGDQGTLGGGAGGTPGGTLGQGAPREALGSRDPGTRARGPKWPLGLPRDQGPWEGPWAQGTDPNPDLTLTKGFPEGTLGSRAPRALGPRGNPLISRWRVTRNPGGPLGGGQGTLGGNPGGGPRAPS